MKKKGKEVDIYLYFVPFRNAISVHKYILIPITL